MLITDRQFKATNEIGKLGETEFYDRHASSWMYSITDVSPDLSYRAKDIDFLVENVLTGKQTTVEIKTDVVASKTGNILIEDLTNKECNTPGYIRKSQADILVYFFPNGLSFQRENALYVNLTALKEFVARESVNRSLLTPREFFGGYDPYNRPKTVVGWSLPIRTLMKLPNLVIVKQDWGVSAVTNDWKAA